jgi:hypothetical protein
MLRISFKEHHSYALTVLHNTAMKSSTYVTGAQFIFIKVSLPCAQTSNCFNLKRAGLLMLISLLLMQSGGIMILYHLRQSLIRDEMKEALESNTTLFEKLTLPKARYLQCRIGSDEISVDGKMYDVKSVRDLGSSVELLTIDDVKEKQTINDIKTLTDKNSQQEKQLPYQLIQLLSLNYISALPDFSFLLNGTICNAFLYYCDEILNRISDFPSPPPKLA